MNDAAQVLNGEVTPIHGAHDSQTKGKRDSKSSPRTEEKENLEAEISPKMNAFEFMMHSRNKSIGRNSPGRELDLSQPESVSVKEQLMARKSRLESWAAAKGAAKRKRDYDEIGDCIDYKLAKRERKLKKMLNIESQSDDEVVTKRVKKFVVVDSDSENDGEKMDVKEKSKVKKKRSRLSLNKKQSVESEELSKLTPKSIKRWKLKIKLATDANAEPKEDGIENEEKATNGNQELLCEKLSECEDEKSVENEEKPLANGLIQPCPLDAIETKNSTPKQVIDSLVEENTNTGRVLRSRKQQPKIHDDCLSSDEEETPRSKKKTKKDVKVAPVFLKAVPKPKLDPEMVEAKRQFLLSGVPSSLKKEMERQQCAEEAEFEIFPTVSHVQQKMADNQFWELPIAKLNLKHETCGEFKIGAFPAKMFTSLGTPYEDVIQNEFPLKKIKNCKRIITEIKSQNPDYPVYKIFNSIYDKSGYKVLKPEKISVQATKRRGRPKKKSPKKPELVPLQVQNEDIPSMWTEKYKPKSSVEIIGNHGSVLSLKEWLTNWLISPQKKNQCDSESEFEVTDGDSRDSGRMFGNTVILKGPTGSGKTAAIYAVCNELDFEVLEVNASSKRTGKRLQQELQEATQSHQVCKKDNILSNFVKDKKEKKEKKSTKMCVLLIEDIDVVFEQDEGFSAALSQIITTSKRPIILTTTDEPGNGIQKLINNHRTISFLPLTSILTIWLQIVCLVEGLYIDARSLDELLRYNRGDIRRTLLQLQLYVNSGGQYKQHIENRTEICIENAINVEDDNSNLSDLKLDDHHETVENIQVHRDCVDICLHFTNYESFSLPSYTDLEVIWWNIPSILSLSTNKSCENVDKISKGRLKMLSDCYDSMVFADLMCGQSQFCASLKPKWRTKPKNSIELEEIKDSYRDHEFCNELAHTTLSQRIKTYKENWDRTQSRLSLSVPEASIRRWRAKQQTCENKLQDALLVSDCLLRKAVSLDYMPALRSITRSELKRATTNNKRGNRFYSYLKNLGLRGADSTYKMACDIFQ